MAEEQKKKQGCKKQLEEVEKVTEQYKRAYERLKQIYELSKPLFEKPAEKEIAQAAPKAQEKETLPKPKVEERQKKKEILPQPTTPKTKRNCACSIRNIGI